MLNLLKAVYSLDTGYAHHMRVRKIKQAAIRYHKDYAINAYQIAFKDQAQISFMVDRMRKIHHYFK
ncbi:MAG: hypothetical protein NVSMB28_04370 [Collimonas sp.]